MPVKQVPLLGLLLSLFSACLFGLCNVIVKYVDSVDPFTIAVYRFLGIAMPAASVVIYKKQVKTGLCYYHLEL